MLRKKVDAVNKAMAQAFEDLGDEAADAADPRSLRKKRGVSDIEDLAEKLGDTSTSRPAGPTVEGSDSE
jgi:hypothetical protein